MLYLARLFAVCLALIAAAQPLPAQSSLMGVDIDLRRLVRSSDDPSAAPLILGDVIHREVIAIDLGRDARLLYFVRYDAYTARYMIELIEPETGQNPRTSGFAVSATQGEVTDLSVAPFEAAIYYVSVLGQDVSIWKLLDGQGTPILVATLPSFGRTSGLAITRDERIHLLRDATQVLVEIDAQGVPVVIGSTGLVSGTASGLDADWATGALVTVVGTASTVPRIATIDPNTGRATFVRALAPGRRVRLAVARSAASLPFDDVCGPANPGSTGLGARMTAQGLPDLSRNDLVIGAQDMPPGSFGLFLTSTSAAAPVQPAGSSGNLCLGGAIGRVFGPSGLLSTGATGSFEAVIDLSAVPSLFGPVAIEVGTSQYFQAWFRDTNAGAATSNFSNAVALTFGRSIPGPKLGNPRGVGGDGSALRIGDFNDVGRVEVVSLRNESLRTLRVSDSLWPLKDWATSSLQFGGALVSDLEFGDLDGDGLEDVAPPVYSGGPGMVIWNDGEGQHSMTPLMQTCGPSGGLEISDLDGDGRLDIVSGCSSTDRLDLYWNDGPRILTEALVPVISSPFGHLITADMDSDGLMDLVVGVANTPGVMVLQGLGGGGVRSACPPRSYGLVECCGGSRRRPGWGSRSDDC